jgi:four helix bundle protein
VEANPDEELVEPILHAKINDRLESEPQGRDQGRQRAWKFRIADCGMRIWKRMKKELEARTKRFALSVIAFVSKLPRGKASDVIGYQLVKSGTSIGANYREVNRAESHDDFIHKIAICEKEAAETEYWLELTQEANLMASTSTEELLREVRELLSIFVASGRTAKAQR